MRRPRKVIIGTYRPGGVFVRILRSRTGVAHPTVPVAAGATPACIVASRHRGRRLGPVPTSDAR
ncbi:hypothetical protein PSA01_56460 [Pseudonocardia saturnea]|uniref:Uncharacterized protein n=1 Tax=Pseudonocardia saturnea TaxID=33909 RepID=A0ABQ0S6R9_9PSEU|nr:hypothetical protein PSA01_56460 [Pseudonocardia saturnea]